MLKNATVKKEVNNQCLELSTNNSICNVTYFDCTICMSLMYKPFLSKCGHSFCYSCLINLSTLSHKSRRSKCPLCRSELGSTKDWRPNHLVQSILLECFPEECKQREAEYLSQLEQSTSSSHLSDSEDDLDEDDLDSIENNNNINTINNNRNSITLRLRLGTTTPNYNNNTDNEMLLMLGELFWTVVRTAGSFNLGGSDNMDLDENLDESNPNLNQNINNNPINPLHTITEIYSNSANDLFPPDVVEEELIWSKKNKKAMKPILKSILRQNYDMLYLGCSPLRRSFYFLLNGIKTVQ
eukprot:TRINITY_DN2800_c0_g1_i1.p1 TRINITY_DN2800_c0_g1~~TRINITY_DN2800_c0_g1_i1.p1  ORF type:complete len:297 (-),score=52.12 TRINITY_DN2800_c0_g1_i1:25-915(-)